MKTISKFPILKTSSALFCPDLEDHNNILLGFFGESDKVIDIGCGDGILAMENGWLGVDETTDISSLDLSQYNTLHFSESLGYVPVEQLSQWLDLVSPSKIVIKDFLDTRDISIPLFDYSFTRFHLEVLPMLILRGYEVSIKSFNPNNDRWKGLLAECGLPYSPAPWIKSLICIATKQRIDS